MALVRRAVGRAQVPVIPAQPGNTAAPVLAGQEMAAAVPTMPAKGWATMAGLGLTGLSALGAFNIQTLMAPNPFQIGDAMSTFGALFVFAAAVERILEPFSRFMPGRVQQERYEKALADVDNAVPGAMNAAAHYKAAVESARSSRGILMWGIATFVATLLAAGSGFCLLRVLSANPSWDGVSYWLDALITGLVVGSGTKPVHDFVTRIQQHSSS